jgi:hypothetical protein
MFGQRTFRSSESGNRRWQGHAGAPSRSYRVLTFALGPSDEQDVRSANIPLLRKKEPSPAGPRGPLLVATRFCLWGCLAERDL